MAIKVCELAYKEAINAIKDQEEVYVSWYKGGGWDNKLKFAGDYYDPIPTEKGIEKIKNSSFGATVWNVNGNFVIKIPGNMW